MSGSGPGFRSQAGMRTVFRVVGVLSMGAAVVLIGIALADFFATMNSDSMDAPSRFWLFFLAVPLFFIGGVCLNAGFGGAGLRYAAGEAAPVAKDTITYLRDDSPAAGSGQPASRACPSCGAATSSGARFCASCGATVG